MGGAGRFDEAWYLDQVVGAPPDDAIAHFVAQGARDQLQPHPLYDPRFHRANDPSTGRTAVDPFTHFLAGAAGRGVDPHPLFDGSAVTDRHPQAARHPQGPWGWYLDDLDRRVGPPIGWLEDDDAPSPAAYLALVRETSRRHAAVPDHTDVPRSFATFDHAAGETHVAAMARIVAGLDDPPLISVVVPTKDRASVLGATLDSVLAQTYGRFELLVVDDGGTDDTPELLASYDDPRLRTFRQANAGVASARNHGLREARGELVAYLDSDNTWTPTFLEAMLGTLVSSGARAAYAASELRGEDRLEYRGRPFHREALLERNYIDCITLLHERSLLDEVGGFDEGLRRVVDWDLLNRLSAVTDLVYAPFIATSYDVWDEGGERITRTESIGYRYEVRAKQLLDWNAAAAAVPGRTSVVLTVQRDDPVEVATVAAAVREHLVAGEDVEVIVVDDGGPRDRALRLRLLEVATAGVQVLRIADRVSRTAAIDLASIRATGDVLLVVDLVAALPARELHRCAEEVRAGRAAVVQPLLLDVDGTVASSGWLTSSDGRAVTVGEGLMAEDALLCGDRERDAVDVLAYAVDTGTFRRLGGLAPVFVGGGGEIDLGRRVREAGGRCRCSAEVTLVTEAWPALRRHLPSYEDARELARRGGAGAHGTYDALLARTGGLEGIGWEPGPRPSPRGPQRWRAVHVRRPGSRRRWAIKTAVATPAERGSWGDWHFAQALRAALQELGEHAVVDIRRSWYRSSAQLDDIDVALRGTKRYEPPPGRRSALWVISHPAEVTADEAAGFDDVFVASAAFAPVAERRWQRPVTPLLQATDPERFRPHTDPDPALAAPLLFVGNSRGVRRRIVADALEAGLEPTVIGAGWEGLIPERYVLATHVANESLGRHYASAEVVLADHWDDMRQRGFVANRIFDAVASGAAVISDDVAGLDELFGDTVRTYRCASELPALVAQVRAARRDHGPPAIDGHTFLDRARTLVAWADEG